MLPEVWRMYHIGVAHAQLSQISAKTFLCNDKGIVFHGFKRSVNRFINIFSFTLSKILCIYNQIKSNKSK